MKDKIKIRRTWKGVKPYTRIHKDKKKEQSKKSCRNWKP